jgi:proteasome lid subunit RPN8/RPN11
MRFRFSDWLKNGTKTPTNGDEAQAQPAPATQRIGGNIANPVLDVHIWEFRPDNPASPVIQVVTAMPVYEPICRQAHKALPNETGGFLLGYVGRDIGQNRWHLYIDQAEAVEPTEAAPTHFAFSWRDVDRIRSSREKTGRALIGWYHTHPDLGVFLSRTDVEKTHNRLFNDPFQIALVLDPVRGTAAYFCRDGAAVFATPKDEFQLEFDQETTS